jgi:hypothetical protein
MRRMRDSGRVGGVFSKVGRFWAVDSTRGLKGCYKRGLKEAEKT